MSAPELKPCPFCGGGAVLSADMARYPQCACDACGAYCGQANAEGVEAAITAWNTRADLAPAAPKVKALVWVELARGLFGATTPFGCYHVWEGHYQAPCDKMGQPALDPRSEAQADYEARILAALEEQ